MPNNVNITYGSYDFQRDAGPVPFININKEFLRTGDKQKIGVLSKLTLEGTLNMIPSGIVGYKNIDEMQDILCSGFNQDCQEFKVVCDSEILIQQYPRVNSISFAKSNDNWTMTTPFTIELEWNETGTQGEELESINESWDFQINDQSSYYNLNLDGTGDNNMNLFSLTHDVSAKGYASCGTGPEIPGWQKARNYVVDQLGYSNNPGVSGVINITENTFSGWNHSRVQRVGENEGTFQVTESWLVGNTGLLNNAGNAIEDFTATVNYDSQTALTSVSLNGSIEGLEEVVYGTNPGDYEIVRNKYDMASGFLESVRPKFYGRALLLGGPNLNPTVQNYNIGHNPTKGVINYSYSYDNRPCNFITGSLSESISVNDSNPTDVFAVLPILCRPYGPILQDIETVTESTRTVNIEVAMEPIRECVSIIDNINAKPSVTGLLCQLESDLTGNNIQLFKNQDNESWDYRTGRYSRNVSWTYVPCSGEAPNTSFC